jgi:PAS domain S-box-containing protein
MFSLPNITVKTQIYESHNSLVYRAIRQADNLPIILKVLKQDYPTPEELAHYKQEYEITRSLNLDGVIQVYNQCDYERSRVIMLEDFGGESLQKWMQEPSAKYHPFSLLEFLQIAIKITNILGKIHAVNIIHRDINPGNIVFNPDTGIVKIIDFGIATRLSLTHPTFKDPNALEGTLAYMSPEQTGRMNRSLDYRTDFYSLGATFYEMLTGQLPFTTQDVLELVHCHIAKQPVPPCDMRCGEREISREGVTDLETKNKRPGTGNSHLQIPKIISDIVMKLMAKNAEERYQSAWGIKVDLEVCLCKLEKCGHIESFPLATHDISDKLQIPQKLYGREQEVETLLTVFERIMKREKAQKNEEEISQFTTQNLKSKTELMLVVGQSGIGKSALVQEIYKPITQTRGYFIAGKFDQFKRNIPYSAVVSAFRKLMRQLLSESEANLLQWREKLLAALGSNGQVIINVIPEVELVIGKQPPVPEVGSTEAQNRFNFAFQKFIRVFCSQDHPLVIFLDDLQWVDLSTVKLIELMMTDSEMQFLFLIGTYRDNEVSQTDPLIMMLEELRKQGITINQMTLTPLNLKAIFQLIADTLHTVTTAVTPLAELVLHNTGGNPFFVNELLKTLYTENLITFDFKHLNWQWDITQIKTKGITDNVVELMISKLKQLPEPAQQVLQFAACIGADFDLSTLAIICEKLPSEIFPDLVIAIQAGLILPTSEQDVNLLIQDYQFVHDRIQQAAYALIESSQKQAVHLQIGRLFKASSDNLSEQLFVVVDHLNLGVELVYDQLERIEIARLNLKAAQKAKSAAAFSAALEYLVAGIQLVEGDWQYQYELNLTLHQEAAEVAYLCGNLEQMEQWATIVLQKSKTVLEQVKIYEVKIQAYMVQNQMQLALQIAQQALSLLEIRFSEQPARADISHVLSETAANLSGRQIEKLIDLPIMKEPRMLAAMRLLVCANSAAYIAAPEFFPLIVLKQVNLAIKYGNTTQSPFAYAAYGTILCGISELEAGYQYGQLAVNLLERLDARQVQAKTIFTVNAFINHWKKHVNDTLKSLQDAYQAGTMNGDLEFAGYAALTYCEYCYFTGQPLPEVKQKFADFIEAIEQLKQIVNVNYLKIYLQTVLNLSSTNFYPNSLLGSIYDESSNLSLLQQTNDYYGLFNLYTNKLILAYLFQDFEQAIENGKLAETYLNGVTGHYVVAIFYFYYSLTLLASYPIVTDLEQVDILALVTANQAKMQLWAHSAPMNYQHKFNLIEAEKARVLSHSVQAMDLYEQAIQAARENGYIQEEALAYELAAKFYLGRGMQKFAQTYLKEARYCYERWGATAKVSDLEVKYSSLLSQKSRATHAMNASVISLGNRSGNLSGDSLDLAALIKASQAISSKIVLDQLLSSWMKILLENTGAQKGYLLLETEGQLRIEASGEANSESVTVLQSLPLTQKISESIINYVLRTRESVVLNNAAQDGEFVNDSYIQYHQSKSILCMPLISKEQLGCVVYLENDLTANAFTRDRLEIVKVLSAQAMISIENAQLYSKILKREQALRESERKLADYNRDLEIQVAARTVEIVQRENALRQQKELLQTIIDNIPVMIVLYDYNHQVYQLVNREFEQFLGWAQTEIDNMDVLTECYPFPPYRERALEHMTAATGKWQDFKIRLRDGSYVDTSWVSVRLSDIMNLIIGQDIRDRKQAEEASVLTERNRMAREIHDTLAQAFTGIIVHLDAASRRMKTNPDAVENYIKTGRDLARYGLDEARRSVEALRPRFLEEGDLHSALSRLATQMFCHSDVEIVYEVIGEQFPLPNDVENHLFRIGQEALTNVFKYAKASEIRIELIYESEQFYLRIKDNGQGFEKGSIFIGSGFGLLGMTERAERIGAELTIQTALGQGTEVVVSVVI